MATADAVATPAEIAAASATPPLASKARQAVAWTAGITIFQDLLQLGVTLSLTRLLPPEAYGKFTFVNTTIAFFTVLSFREFLNYTLQVRSETETHYQDQFTAGAVIQGTLFLLVNLLAFGLRFTEAYAPASVLLHVMSLLLPLDLVSEFRVKMLERSMEWRRLRTLHAIGLTLGAALALTMAWTGWGAYALLVPSLTMALPFAYDLFVIEGWRPTWEFRRDRYLPAWRFGLLRIGSGGSVSLSTFTESVLLTRSIGFVQLGIYNRALGLAALCCQRLASLLLNALYPVLTRVPLGSDQYRRVSALVIQCLAWTTIPLAFGIGMTSEPVVRLLYGSRWLSTLPLVSAALALSTLLALVQASYTLLLAHQRQRLCLVFDGIRAVGVIAALLLAVPRGVPAYLTSLILLQAGLLIATTTALWREGAITRHAIVGAIVPPLVASTTALLAVRATVATADIVIGPIWTGFAAGALFMLIYLGVLRACFAGLLRDLLSQAPRGSRLLWLLRLQPSI